MSYFPCHISHTASVYDPASVCYVRYSVINSTNGNTDPSWSYPFCGSSSDNLVSFSTISNRTNTNSRLSVSLYSSNISSPTKINHNFLSHGLTYSMDIFKSVVPKKSMKIFLYLTALSASTLPNPLDVAIGIFSYPSHSLSSHFFWWVSYVSMTSYIYWFTFLCMVMHYSLQWVFCACLFI